MSKLLVVDDEPSICWGLSRLGRDLGHEVFSASSAEQALALAQRVAPDVIILDVRLPGIDGLQAMEKFQRIRSGTPIIVMTAYGDLETAVAAVRNGAFEYLVKPFDLEQVQRALERALAAPSLPLESPAAAHVGGMVGHSAAMQHVFKQIALVAASGINVLIHGESGTGKELAARAIHRYSTRAGGPFVAVNAAALSPSLAEAELFGHVRGAFTGAERDHTGLLVQADGGTLFLDEVAEIPLPVQVKLLRALEEREVVPVGGSQPRSTHFGLIAATHQDLAALVQAGRFRHDLYFRLCAFEFRIPPLRERPEDIRALAEHFLSLPALAQIRATISAAALEELVRRPWYGNARELRNAVEHAATLARGGPIGPEHLPSARPQPWPTTAETSAAEFVRDAVQRWVRDQLARDREPHEFYDQFLRLVEPPLLTAVLERHHFQCAAAARTLGMHRTTLRRKLDELGLAAE